MPARTPRVPRNGPARPRTPRTGTNPAPADDEPRPADAGLESRAGPTSDEPSSLTLTFDPRPIKVRIGQAIRELELALRRIEAHEQHLREMRAAQIRRDLLRRHSPAPRRRHA